MGQTTITLQDDAKEQLADQKPDGMSWGDYLLALRDESDQLKTTVNNHAEVPNAIAEQLDRIESAASTVEDRTGTIEKKIDELGPN